MVVIGIIEIIIGGVFLLLGNHSNYDSVKDGFPSLSSLIPTESFGSDFMITIVGVIFVAVGIILAILGFVKGSAKGSLSNVPDGFVISIVNAISCGCIILVMFSSPLFGLYSEYQDIIINLDGDIYTVNGKSLEFVSEDPEDEEVQKKIKERGFGYKDPIYTISPTYMYDYLSIGHKPGSDIGVTKDKWIKDIYYRLADSIIEKEKDQIEKKELKFTREELADVLSESKLFEKILNGTYDKKTELSDEGEDKEKNADNGTLSSVTSFEEKDFNGLSFIFSMLFIVVLLTVIASAITQFMMNMPLLSIGSTIASVAMCAILLVSVLIDYTTMTTRCVAVFATFGWCFVLSLYVLVTTIIKNHTEV